MSTAIMGITPEEARAFDTDIDYRLGAEEAINKVLRRPDIDEVVLAYEADGDARYDFNPGGVEEFLRKKLNAPEELIAYILSFDDNQVHGKLANAIRTVLQKEHRMLTLEQLHEIGEPLRPRDLTLEEIRLYQVIENEKGLKAWLGRQIRIMTKDRPDAINSESIEEIERQLTHIRDWYIETNRPEMSATDWAEALRRAEIWVRVRDPELLDEHGHMVFYEPTLPENVLYVDKDTGYTVQNITVRRDLKVEGAVMDHCVGRSTQYWRGVDEGKTKILSLRDPQNMPKVTIEVDLTPGMKKGETKIIKQIQGPHDSRPEDQYIKILRKFFMSGESYFYQTVSTSHRRRRNRDHHAFLGHSVRIAATKMGEPAGERLMVKSEAEAVSILHEHAKNIITAMESLKRKRKKDETVYYGTPFKHPTIKVHIRGKTADEFGVFRLVEEVFDLEASASLFGGDVSSILSSLASTGHDKLTPELKTALDGMIYALVMVDELEKKKLGEWNEGMDNYIAELKTERNQIRKRKQSSEKTQHVLDHWVERYHRALENRKRSNLLGFASPDIIEAVHRRPDSFTDYAQQFILDPESHWQAKFGAVDASDPWMYFLESLFEAINKHELFTEEAKAATREGA